MKRPFRTRSSRSLFTFLLEFHGGTYIAQYQGRTVAEAKRRWSAGEAVKLTGQWQPLVVAELFGALASSKPTPLNGLVGAWCVSSYVNKSLALLNIVKTNE
jgi:hypothetical protein